MKARKLASGAWNCRVMVNGKAYSFTDSDKRRAMRRAAEFAEQCRKDVANPTLGTALEQYVSVHADSLSPSTIRGYNSIVRATRTRHPQIASKRCLSLTDRDITDIVRGKSAKTQRNYITLIQSATGRKFSVPVKGRPPKDVAVPSELEVLGLINLFDRGEMEVPVMLGAYAGLRRGEISALTINDLDGNFLHITKDMVFNDSHEWIIKEPKTPSSIRTVLLPPHVADRICQKGYITHLTPNNITKRFIKRQQTLGVDPPYTFHSLRHYFASYLHAQNIPDAYIMRAGGWSTPHVMQRVYRHALDETYLECAQNVVSAFQKSLQNT